MPKMSITDRIKQNKNYLQSAIDELEGKRPAAGLSPERKAEIEKKIKETNKMVAKQAKKAISIRSRAKFIQRMQNATGITKLRKLFKLND